MLWKAEYETGIRNIDEQHRAIVEFVNLFEQAGENRSGRNYVPGLISRARTFVEFHFRVEECLMQLLPYPDAESHAAEHRNTLREIERLERLECQTGHESARGELARQMRGCLLGHIVTGDKWLAQYALELYDGQSSAVAGTSGTKLGKVVC
ncbi:MAG: hemerythrin domain-containing protein [Burkholderiales bacterium]|nr:hemerythrin domain-containing protein [Burkholderiales bacterium]